MSAGAKKKDDNVKVVIRCRPLSDKEKKNGNKRCVEMATSTGTITVNNMTSGDSKNFTFDAIYDWNSQQQDIYDETARPIVDAVLQGYNGTIFAYGQTGTGKTFTMEGVRSKPELRGIIPNSFEHIFTEIARTEGKQFLVRAAYLELYMEEVRDLLSKDQKQRLQLKEKPDTGVYVKDLSSFVVKSVKEIEHVMNVGNKNRSVGVTDMNQHSSRSHAIFIVTIECSERGLDGENHIRVGKLNLVDLAGSERQSKTHAEGQRLKEATKINLSLSCLGNVIFALVESRSKGGRGKAHHIPYRDSQLTRLLQDSLGGNAKTVMIANIGPADYNFEETITTLRYANRAKNIKNEPHINEDPKDALLREFQEEIERLKSQLEKKGGVRRKDKKKKKRSKERGGGGEGDEEEEGETEEEEEIEVITDEAEAKRIMEQERAKLEAEKQAMLQDTSIVEEEKERLLAEMQARERQLKDSYRENQELAAKIAAMQSKLLKGQDVVDRTTEQEHALHERRQQLAEQKQKEREMKRKLEEKEEKRIEAQETFSSLQQEVDIKTRKLKKLFDKMQNAKQEIEDLKEEFAREREELLETMEELQRELKLRQHILDNFVPPEEVKRIKARAIFDEEQDQWRLMPQANAEHQNAAILAAAKRPVSAVAGRKRPITEFARLRTNIDRNPRYRHENIYLVELDMPDRTTQDYAGPMVAPGVQAALDDALRDEEDIKIEASPEDFLDAAMKKARRAKKQAARPSTASSKVRKERRPEPEAGAAAAQFPKSRGLVGDSRRFA